MTTQGIPNPRPTPSPMSRSDGVPPMAPERGPVGATGGTVGTSALRTYPTLTGEVKALDDNEMRTGREVL